MKKFLCLVCAGIFLISCSKSEEPKNKVDNGVEKTVDDGVPLPEDATVIATSADATQTGD